MTRAHNVGCEYDLPVDQTVRVDEARCPNCGPRLFSVCDGCGCRQDFPADVDVVQVRSDSQLCACGEQILFALGGYG